MPAKALSVGGVWRPGSDSHSSTTQAKYLYAAAVVGTGTSVFVADLRTRLKADPFGYVYGDADVEAPGSSGGQMMVAMDYVMGWSQMCETYQIQRLNSNLWYAAGTHESRELLARIAYRLANTAESAAFFAAPDEVAAAEPYLLTEELLAPAHDGVTRAGASTRVLDERCFGSSVASFPSPQGSAAAINQRKILETRAFRSKVQVLSEGCVATTNVAAPQMGAPWVPPRAMPKPRPLNWVVPKEAAFPLASACEQGLQALCETVKRVAINREARAAVRRTPCDIARDTGGHPVTHPVTQSDTKPVIQLATRRPLHSPSREDRQNRHAQVLAAVWKNRYIHRHMPLHPRAGSRRRLEEPALLDARALHDGRAARQNRQLADRRAGRRDGAAPEGARRGALRA